MKTTFLKGMVKWSVIASMVMLVTISSTLFSASPLYDQENGDGKRPLKNQNFAPRTQDITEEDNYTGVGQPLSAVEYANSTNASQQISPFNNNSYGLGYIDLPPQWTGYELFAEVSSVSDNRTWVTNGTINAQSPWQYDENDDVYGIDSGGLNQRETCWGWFNGTPPTGTTTGALFLHNGYDAHSSNHAIDPGEYCQWDELTYVDREDISAVRCEFDYWLNHTNYGAAQFFVEINEIKRSFPFFEGFATNWTWKHQAFDLTPNEVATLTTPGTINITLGIDVLIGPFSMTVNDGPGGYTFQEIYLDNITLLVRGNAKPSQVQLKLNMGGAPSTVNDLDYGSGYTTLTGSWPNPSISNFLALKGNYTSNETGVQLTTSFTLYANRTKQSQTLENIPGSVFWVSNNTDMNWTAYYYAYTPYRYDNYNFTLSFPASWTPWAVFDPSPASVMSDLVVGSGYIRVDSTKANRPGLWRIEFSAPKVSSQVLLYRNSTPGKTSWVESSQFVAGDYLNVTATITGAVIGTRAQLNVKFPNGTLWNSQTNESIVGAGGIATFYPIRFPFTNGSDYVVGTYKVFVSWNNSISGSYCNETSLIATTFSVQHPSKVIPETTVYEDLVQDDKIEIFVNFLDKQYDIAITGGFLWFTNMTGDNQTMNMVNPGRYFAETQVIPFDLAGEIILTIHGNHTLYTESIANISLRYTILTSLVSNSTQLSVIWGESFTFEVNFTDQVTFQGISTATVTTDWDFGNWTSLYKGNGNYSITCNSSSKTANRLHTILVDVEAPGFIGKSMAFSVFITPREAFLLSVLINGVNVTSNKSMDLPVTSSLNFTVKWWDLGNWGAIGSADLQVVGVGSTPFDFTQVGDEYQCLVSGAILNLGTHYITVAAAKSNFKDSTMALEIQEHRIRPSFRTADNTILYNINVESEFTLGIYIDNVDFGGIITGATVEYSWSEGSGVLTDPEGKGYYSAAIGKLPEGEWEFNIRVYIGPNYEYKEYSVSVSVVPVEGLPPWLLYLMIIALAGLVVGMLSYLFYFRFPPSVRQIRSFKRSIKKDGTRPIVTKSLDTLLAEDYLNESQGLLPSTTQIALKNRYLKEQKAPKGARDDISLSPASSAEKKDTNTGGASL